MISIFTNMVISWLREIAINNVEFNTQMTFLDAVEDIRERASYGLRQYFADKLNDTPGLYACIKAQDQQSEIIRCKDCKNGGLDSSGINGYWCSAHTEWHDGDWFCADGEKEELK